MVSTLNLRNKNNFDLQKYKKIIAFSLWGDNPKYTIGAIKNAQLLNTIYPGWNAWFYCGTSVPEDIIEYLNGSENCEVFRMNEPGDWMGMFWRFYPASIEDVDVMLSRDCDSRLNKREKLAVDEWLKSDKNFHIMRDHPWHTTEILGGMWGVRGNMLSNMKDMIDNYVKEDIYKVDENFLKEHIYNKVKNDCFVHDEFFSYDATKRCFPEKRNGQEFVGEVLDEFDTLNFQQRNMIIVYSSPKEKLRRIFIKLMRIFKRTYL